ncbi:gliding motility-associated C-terminal domain-containing protein [uncultured Kordia sp.]|uniref:T9SS type B sorting domain-containing protein n=1 Tax=uncultured Kordia sp. TaxID=507699 RepID=UPI0026351D08|nr:gliding motility-associated C-terminal domain-containing protein [uncultured Kordia sp.]
MKLPVTTLFLLTFSFTLAQGEANIWYFGRNAGLDFNSGVPVAINDGQLNTGEGCATMADANGQLLFYTDGITVWDKNHSIMPNGTELLGDSSSTQSAVIVPKPGDSDIYYVFTVDDFAGVNGLRFSEVDLTLNGGNGDVTSVKNVLLRTPTTEKVTAVRHCNGVDFWIVSHDLNTNFLSYEVTNAGVNTSPVISTLGSTHVNPFGYLKISPNGKKIVSAIARASIDVSYMEIFDFDTATGIISNPIQIGDIFHNDYGGAYGVDFSPNSQLLYVSDFNLFGMSKMYQFDLSFDNAIDIINSSTILYEGFSNLGAVQLGPDNKVYIANAGTTFLDVIENPNIVGMGAGYTNSGVSLNGNQVSLGLPTFIQSIFETEVSLNTTNVCLGEVATFSFTTSTNVSSYLWSFGDGTTATTEFPEHIYEAPGTYTVFLDIDSECQGLQTFSQEITVFEVPIIPPISDVTLCEVENQEINLSQFNTDVLGNQTNSNFVVSYHENQEDAENGSNPLDTNYTSFSNQVTMYARLENSNSSLCYDIKEFNIEINENCIIPRGISPNNDGLNDTFDISWLKATSVKIFNRNGVEVFQARNYKNEWSGQDKNGNIVPTGTYFYVITDENQEVYNGWVYVKR